MQKTLGELSQSDMKSFIVIWPFISLRGAKGCCKNFSCLDGVRLLWHHSNSLRGAHQALCPSKTVLNLFMIRARPYGCFFAQLELCTHPVRNRVAIKVNFTEKAMAELKSLGKRLQE